MPSPLLISASLLSADFLHLADQIAACENAGVDWLHIDVLDGHFAPNISMGPFIVEHCRRQSGLPLDVHLMIEKPERYVPAFAAAGADRLSVHIEGNPNIHRTLQEIRALNVSPGIVINPGTPVSAITAVLPHVDMVLVMSVNPGFSGQSFLPETLDKVREIRQIAVQNQLDLHIQIDGGITAQTLPAAYHAGITVAVAATAIFKHPQGIAAGVAALRNSIA